MSRGLARLVGFAAPAVLVLTGLLVPQVSGAEVRRLEVVGADCHIGEPGFMRLCFAGLPTDAVVAGVQAAGRCWVGPTTWHGRRAVRISVSAAAV